jgi:preprotein translocase subunit SecG
MTAVLIALNIIAGLFLVAVVLLQAGKGADMGAAFGGANPAAFGPAAQGNVLQKITAATAAIFMGSSPKPFIGATSG